MADSQYAEIHNRAFDDGHKELAQTGDTVPPDESILGSGVVNGKKECNRIEGEEEIYVSEFHDHGIRFNETRWTRRAVSRALPLKNSLTIENLVRNLWELQSCGKHATNQDMTELEGGGCEPWPENALR